MFRQLRKGRVVLDFGQQVVELAVEGLGGWWLHIFVRTYVRQNLVLLLIDMYVMLLGVVNNKQDINHNIQIIGPIQEHMNQFSFEEKIQKLYQYRDRICSNPIRNIITLLIVTIIPITIPMAYFSFTKYDRVVTKLSSQCVSLLNGTDTKSGGAPWTDQLCISCFYRQQAMVPEEFQITVRQADNYVYTKYPLSHNKKVLSIDSKSLQINTGAHESTVKYINLSQQLSCRDFLHTLNYQTIISNKQLAINQRLSEIQFDTEVKSIEKLVSLIGMTISQEVDTDQMLVEETIGMFGIVQLIRREQGMFKGTLLEIQYPRLTVVETFIKFLQILDYLACIICFAIFGYKLYEHRQFYYEILTHLTILVGLVSSLQNHGLESSNTYYFLSVVLYACLTFQKVQVTKLNTILFGVFTATIYLLAPPSLLIPIKLIICILTIIIVFLNTYRSFQHRPYFIYLWAVWLLFTFLEVKFLLYDDFRSILCSYMLIIISVVVMEVINKEKLVIFGEEILADDTKRFKRIENMEEEDTIEIEHQLENQERQKGQVHHEEDQQPQQDIQSRIQAELETEQK